LTVVNAANIAKDLEWIQSPNETGAVVRDASEELALLSIQGPRAEDVLSALTDLELGKIKYYRFADGVVAGKKTMVSRTGYTGEDGFELMVDAGSAESLWWALIEAGAPEGLKPVGLGARDTLRLEAKMALYGNDIDEEHTVLEADLGWIVKLEKGDFIGREVLARQRQDGPPRKLVGFEMVDRGIARHGYPVFVGDKPSELVTSGTFAPFLKKSIGLAYVPTESAVVGTELEIDIRGRRAKARVVPTPFYRRD
jgi:aminomethyltransferase